uniref:Uncharacterized protein n=1 Tax=Rhizophora mucronata TaxID=61149 RepID=A0A2P2NSG9_RHIMU
MLYQLNTSLPLCCGQNFPFC